MHYTNARGFVYREARLARAVLYAVQHMAVSTSLKIKTRARDKLAPPRPAQQRTVYVYSAATTRTSAKQSQTERLRKNEIKARINFKFFYLLRKLTCRGWRHSQGCGVPTTDLNVHLSELYWTALLVRVWSTATRK